MNCPGTPPLQLDFKHPMSSSWTNTGGKSGPHRIAVHDLSGPVLLVFPQLWVPSAGFCPALGTRRDSDSIYPPPPRPPVPCAGPSFEKRKIKHFFSSFLSKQIFPRASQ